MAYGIASKYPSVVDLTRGMRMHGAMMLEDIKVGFSFLDKSILLIGAGFHLSGIHTESSIVGFLSFTTVWDLLSR
jgi:hypothetical protein